MAHVFLFEHLLTQHLPDAGAQPCIQDGERSHSVTELDTRCREFASWLQERGIHPGDRVGIHLRKSADEVAAMLAASYCGAVFVNINHQWTGAQLDYVLADCGVRFLITNKQGAKAVGQTQTLSDLSAVLCLGTTKPPVPAGDAGFEVHPWSAPAVLTPGPADHGRISSDLAAILYTSGSTGSPKGVMLTHSNLVQGARSVATYLQNRPGDRLLSLLPFSFDYGLNQLTTMLLVGGSVVLQQVPMATEIVRSLARHRCTGFAAVPPTWVSVARLLSESPTELPELRYITNSGGKIPPHILEQLPTAFPGADIVLMYGLTEAFRSTWLPPELFAAKRGSMGRAIPNNQVYVIGEEGICGPDEVGELVHRGDLVSAGYWGKPEATAEKIRPCPQLRKMIGEEPVVYSGDLVKRDEDGFLWFVGRKDHLIKCSGFRISPNEVEDIVSTHEAVAETAAFGVDDDDLGQVVHIAVCPKDAGDFDTEAVQRHCAQRMPGYMIPKRIHVHDGPLPKTSSGKMDTSTIAAMYRNTQASTS